MRSLLASLILTLGAPALAGTPTAPCEPPPCRESAAKTQRQVGFEPKAKRSPARAKKRCDNPPNCKADPGQLKF